MPGSASLDDFYRKTAAPLPEGLSREIGHFNVFETEKVIFQDAARTVMPYTRRNYYKISWLRGRSRVEYADKVIEVERDGLLYATPKIPYHWIPQDGSQTGMFCIFTSDFLARQKSGVILADLPIFQPGQVPVFQLSPQEVAEMESIFRKMLRELSSDYAYKYDLLRTLVLELIHYGQKLQPLSALQTTPNASHRISALFIELLERQFPLESTGQRLSLRTAKDYAHRLAVHVNHLNKVLKEVTGRTTTEIIAARMEQEAKILLRQTDWAVADIAYSLGFDEPAHFSHFFKRQTGLTPMAFRA
jgi:AraC-like DNA-binding protein